MTKLQQLMANVITTWNNAIETLIDTEPTESGKLDVQTLMIPNYPKT